MKRFAWAVLALGQFAACTGSTMIKSTPSGALVYLDGEKVGTTPYNMVDKRIVGSSTNVELRLDGYQPTTAQIHRNEELDVGALVGGIFVLIPLLWIMEYKPNHEYEMKPAAPPSTAQ